MKKKHYTYWILAGVVTSLLMPQFSAMAADKVVVIPLGDSLASSGTFTVQPADLVPLDESQAYNLQGGPTPTGASGSQLTCPGAENDGEFLAPVYLPDGVFIRSFFYHGFDNTAGDLTETRLKKVCQAANAAPVITSLTLDVGTTVAEAPGFFTASELNIDDKVDNSLCHYHVAVDLEGNGCQDANIIFNKAVIFWSR